MGNKEQQTWLAFYVPGRYTGAVEQSIFKMLVMMRGILTTTGKNVAPLLLFGRLASCYEAFQIEEKARLLGQGIEEDAVDAEQVRAAAANGFLLALKCHVRQTFAPTDM